MGNMTQGQAVYLAVTSVVGEPRGKVLEYITPSQLKEVHEEVFQLFKSGETSHSKNPSEDELRKYIPGLVNNWLRKDPKLNGGSKYEAKNPGSRAGSGDASLKNMKLLLQTVTDPNAKQAIQEEIEKRKTELAAKKQPVVNLDAIPEHLRQFAQR